MLLLPPPAAVFRHPHASLACPTLAPAPPQTLPDRSGRRPQLATSPVHPGVHAFSSGVALSTAAAALEAAAALDAGYSVGRQIGRGSFAVVLEVTDRRSGETLCAKKLPRYCHTRPPCQQSQLVAAEASIQRVLGAASSSVLRLHDVRQDDLYYYLISELCQTDLKQHLKDRLPVPEREAAHIIHQLLTALHTCHSHSVAYRDIKAANVLIRSSAGAGGAPDVCLADFGCARSVLGPQPTQRSSPGTPLYSAPECVHGACGTDSDIWAAGILLYEMLSGGFPFCDPRHAICQGEYWKRVKQMPISYCGPGWQGVSEGAISLVKSMLERDRSRRTTAKAALQDAWLVETMSNRPSAHSRTNTVATPVNSARLYGNVVPGVPAVMLPIRT